MSKIEVLRTPDERLEPWMVRSLTVPALRLLDGSVVAVKEGDLVVVSHSGVEDEWSTFAHRTIFPRESVAALLAAVMEDAGAVLVRVDASELLDPDDGSYAHVSDGPAWLLPIPEDME